MLRSFIPRYTIDSLGHVGVNDGANMSYTPHSLPISECWGLRKIERYGTRFIVSGHFTAYLPCKTNIQLPLVILCHGAWLRFIFAIYRLRSRYTVGVTLENLSERINEESTLRLELFNLCRLLVN